MIPEIVIPIALALVPVPVPARAEVSTPAHAEVVRPEARHVARGLASTYGPGYAGYLALPEGPGVRVRICGPAACVVRTSNDAGPDRKMQRRGRVVDLDVATFETVCGCGWRAGLVRVSVEYLR